MKMLSMVQLNQVRYPTEGDKLLFKILNVAPILETAEGRKQTRPEKKVYPEESSIDDLGSQHELLIGQPIWTDGRAVENLMDGEVGELGQ